MALKRPDAVSFSKKNVVHPFEPQGTQSLEFWAQKNDASVFLVGQTSKKRPNNLTFVRMYDYRVLDVIEVGVDKFVPMSDFKVRPLSLLCHIAYRTYHPFICRPRNPPQATSH